MPLRLNLYHEVEKEAVQRQRDPLKMAMLALIVIGVGMAIYYTWGLASLASARNAYAARKAEFDGIEAAAAAARHSEAALIARVKTGDTLAKRMEDRFLWAPVLELLTMVVPPDVQLSKLSGETTADTAKRCTISLDGIAVGADPRKVAEDMRQSITDAFSRSYREVLVKFRTLEDGADTLPVDGKPQPTAVFSITVQFTGAPEAKTANATQLTQAARP